MDRVDGCLLFVTNRTVSCTPMKKFDDYKVIENLFMNLKRDLTTKYMRIWIYWD